MRVRQSTPPQNLHALVALQHADGSWDLTPELATILGRDLSDLESALAGTGHRPDARRAWATALALVWLDVHGGHTRDEWQLLANKARRWLDVAAPVPLSGQTWMREAEAVILPQA